MIAERPTSDPARWVDEHGDILYRYARTRLRDEGAVEDAVQETFLAALKARNRFSGRSSERTWLIGILRHKIIDHIRKESRTRLVEDTSTIEEWTDHTFDRKGHWRVGPAEWRVNPRMAFEQKEFTQVLHRCLDALDERSHMIFTLRELEGMDIKDLCALLDVSPNYLSVMLHRTRARLRRLLEQHWVSEQPFEEPALLVPETA